MMAPAGIRYTYPSVPRAPSTNPCLRAVIEYGRAQQNMIILHKGKSPSSLLLPTLPPPTRVTGNRTHINLLEQNGKGPAIFNNDDD